MLELKQLRIFKTIVEVGSFTQAGARLSLSQPAISQHIRALEEQLGVPLLLRVGKRARPTPAGDVLLQCAQQVLEKIEDVERVLAAQGEGRTGTLRVGSGDAASQHLLPAVLEDFVRAFPRVHLQLLTGHGGTTVARLLRGELDLGLVTLPIDTGRLRVTEIGRDELVAVVPPGHRWAGERRVRAADFAGEPLVLYDRQSPLTTLVLQFLLEEGVFPRIALEVDRLTVVSELVRLRLGVGVVPLWTVGAELAAGTLCALSLGTSGLVRPWGLAHLDQARHSAALNAFVRLAVERLPRLLAANGERGAATTNPASRA